MRDYSSGHFSQYNSSIVPNTTMNISSINSTTCICNNLLEEVNNLFKLKAVYNFYVNDNFTAISKIEIDVIIGVNINSKCSSKYLLKQTFSTRFIKDTQVISKLFIFSELYKIWKSRIFIRLASFSRI